MTNELLCWECLRPAPGGVCTREHPGFSLYAGRACDYVERPAGNASVVGTLREPEMVNAECAGCGVTFRKRSDSKRRTCCRGCLVVVRERNLRQFRKSELPGLCPACGFQLLADALYVWCDRCGYDGTEDAGRVASPQLDRGVA